MIKPIKDNVVVKIDAAEETKTPGGIIMSAAHAEKPNQGEVVAVGPGIVVHDGEKAGEAIPLVVKVGDRVLFYKGSGVEQKIDGVDYLILREDHILGIF